MASYSNEEYADIIMCYGFCQGVSRAARTEYHRRYPERRLPDASVFDTCIGSLLAASPVSAVSYMAGRGPLTLPGGAVGLAFARSSLASDDHSATRPDIELVMGGGSLAGDLLGILRSLLGVTDQWYWKVYGSLPLNVRQNSFSINPVLIRPRSVGRLKLRTANFTDPPIIHMNYFHDPKDLKALVHGIRLVSDDFIVLTVKFRSR
ncbi:hypothetical protein ACJJTC_010042 [Scirpophaga incertulas]